MKKTKSVIIGILLIASILTIVTPVSAATITVNPGQSIQDAINSASAGDTILVYPGTYDGYIDIQVKNLRLMASGNVILKSSTTDRVININPNLGTVTIEGFTVYLRDDLGNPGGIIQGMGSSEGTAAYILNNKVIATVNLRNGIQVTGDNSKVIGNIVQGAPLTENWSGSGIHVVNANNVLVKNNKVSGGDNAIAITEWGHNKPIKGMIIEDNLVENVNDGIYIYGWVEDTLIRRNTITKTTWAGILEWHNPTNGTGAPKGTIARNNEIIGNEVADIEIYGSNIEEDHILDARFNWWGSNLGPNTEKLIGPIDYIPWERRHDLPMDQISRILGIGTITGPVGEIIEEAEVSENDS